jgi:Putative transposase
MGVLSNCRGRVGVIAILHTFNGRLEFNSHVHTMVTGGGLSESSDIWASPLCAEARSREPPQMCHFAIRIGSGRIASPQLPGPMVELCWPSAAVALGLHCAWTGNAYKRMTKKAVLGPEKGRRDIRISVRSDSSNKCSLALTLSDRQFPEKILQFRKISN